MSQLLSLPYFNYLLITASIWFVYWYVVSKCGFVSDDHQGISGFDGKLQVSDQKDSKLHTWQKLFKSEYGMISRWLRVKIAGKVPRNHHILILVVFNIACLLTYSALAKVIGANLALMAIGILIVHPVSTQAVAWCSAIGYPLSLLWIGAMLTITQWAYPLTPSKLCVALPLFLLAQFLGIHAQFIPMMTCVILWFLGYKLFAVIGGVVSAIMLFDIIKQTIKLRKDEFIKQKMGDSTKISPRKFIVAMKTILYYLGLSVAPIKMGLYHKWGFHYDKSIEKADRYFWLGLVGFIGLLGILTLSPIVAVRLGILWFLAFSVIFWNWVTIQQFVTERYIFIPTLGLGMIIAYLTQNHLWAYGFIVGAYLVRTWCHLPTYDNELRFYQSNNWNFPESEVALGNLGVTYINVGMEGTAIDTWGLATQINPDYDVPWYNIFSTHRTKAVMAIQHGRYMDGINYMQQAIVYLDKVLACKVCHFPEMWNKERDHLKKALANPQLLFQEELGRLESLSLNLRYLKIQATTPERLVEVETSVRNNSIQIQSLKAFMDSNGISTFNGNSFMLGLLKENK